MNENKLKKNTAILSLISNSFLIVIKLMAGLLSGSVGIISEAIHSGTDCLASYITFFAVKKSSESPDTRHQFGHGKYEDFSGLVEGVLINIAALYILAEAGKNIIIGNHNVVNIDIAAYVMIFSVVVNIIVSTVLFKVAKKTGSIALYADGEHLRTDVYTSVGVALGMIMIKLTGIHILDSMIALVVAVMIFHTGLKICRKATSNLLDEGLPESDISKISDIVKSFTNEGILETCKIRTRTSGPRINIELTIYAQETMTVKESHRICNEIESKLNSTFNKVDTIIHIEPKCNAKSYI